MTKCEVMNLAPSDSGSDSDFIQATRHFCTASVSVSSFCYNGNYFKGLVHVVVMYCSLAKSGAQSHLRCKKLGVSLRDVDLGEGETNYWL